MNWPSLARGRGIRSSWMLIGACKEAIEPQKVNLRKHVKIWIIGNVGAFGARPRPRASHAVLFSDLLTGSETKFASLPVCWPSGQVELLGTQPIYKTVVTTKPPWPTRFGELAKVGFEHWNSGGPERSGVRRPPLKSSPVKDQARASSFPRLVAGVGWQACLR